MSEERDATERGDSGGLGSRGSAAAHARGEASPAADPEGSDAASPGVGRGEAGHGGGGDVGSLREENQRLRAECDRCTRVEREVMQLLGTTNPQKIVHDLRNVLNELALLQALASDNP